MSIQGELVQSASLDLASIAANAAILIAFLGAVIAGIAKGMKELRGNSPSKPEAATAMILDNISIREWSSSNADVARSIQRLTEAVDDCRREMTDNTDELRSMRRLLDAINPRQ